MSIVLADKVFPEIAAWGDELTAIRREIHSHPELGFDTAVTVSRIVTLLKKWGIEKIDTDIVKGGVIVEMKLPCFQINVSRKDIVKYDIFHEIASVIFFIIELFYA